MVAPKKTRRVVCTVIRLPEEPMSATNRLSEQTLSNDTYSSSGSLRPSQLLPWADPMISKLVNRLQNEVRAERSSGGKTLKFLKPEMVETLASTTTSELEPATPSLDTDYEGFEPGFDLPRWQPTLNEPNWNEGEQTAGQTK